MRLLKNLISFFSIVSIFLERWMEGRDWRFTFESSCRWTFHFGL